MVDSVSYVQGTAQPLVIIHHSHVSTASLSRGTHRPTFLAASTLSLGLAWEERGMGALYI